MTGVDVMPISGSHLRAAARIAGGLAASEQRRVPERRNRKRRRRRRPNRARSPRRPRRGRRCRARSGPRGRAAARRLFRRWRGVRVLPNVAEVTVVGVSDVSFRFWPVRATSLWYVTTSVMATGRGRPRCGDEEQGPCRHPHNAMANLMHASRNARPGPAPEIHVSRYFQGILPASRDPRVSCHYRLDGGRSKLHGPDPAGLFGRRNWSLDLLVAYSQSALMVVPSFAVWLPS